MPRYFFHFTYRGSVFPDRKGLELDDLKSARSFAERLAQTLSAAPTATELDRSAFMVWVADESGLELLRVSASD